MILVFIVFYKNLLGLWDWGLADVFLWLNFGISGGGGSSSP